MAILVDEEPNLPRHRLFGRERELEWLFNRHKERRDPIVISGPPGIGKTALLRKFLADVRARRPAAIWTARGFPSDAMAELVARVEELYGQKEPPEIVAIDDAESLSDNEMNRITSRVLNLKAIRTLIFVSRRRPFNSRAEVLNLNPLENQQAERMLKSLVSSDLSSEDLSLGVKVAEGLPLALTTLAALARGREAKDFARLLTGNIYNLGRGLIIPERKLITEIKPRITFVNNALVERLRGEPKSVFALPPRKFEELIAELLADMGYEVELTPATRDGGKDILAHMPTPHGRILCLVEAKKYRQDRPVGVELIRQLYGTLTDADANSAMLVTTSSFSRGAQEFQSKHRYKLALRDYSHVVQWIQGYGEAKRLT